jgi:hypothetical protein
MKIQKFSRVVLPDHPVIKGRKRRERREKEDSGILPRDSF